MPEITLTAEAGRTTGSRAAGRARRAGKIPAVVYGHGIDPLAVSVNARELRAALTTAAGLNALLELNVDGTNHLTMARSLQRDPVRSTVTHIDFQIVRRDEIVTAEVSIQLVGEAVELHRGDGVVGQEVFSLTVHTTPGKIPAHIDVDISELNIGDTIRIGDIKLPDGVTTEVDPESAVVIGQPPQVSEADLVTEDEAEAAAAGEAAEEAGETGAEGGAESESGGDDSDSKPSEDG